MAFARSTEQKDVARVFVRTTRLTDIECNSAISSGKAPASGGWVQLFTADGGAVFRTKRTTSNLENQQQGVIGTVIDREDAELDLTLSAAGLDELIYLGLINPAQPTGDALGTGVGLKENRGFDMTTLGLSFLIYDKGFDPTNETDTPSITADAEAWLLFKAVPTSEITDSKNNVQNSQTITFSLLANTGSGSAKGFKGRIGAFTAGY
jgi:hypothetical protein